MRYTHVKVILYHMGVSINGGTPKWMVYKVKSHLGMDDDLGVALF